MPSKRKKNKRRMRRVQAQRNALEDQYGSFGKGAQGVCAVSAPVTTRVPVAKTLEPSPVVPVKTHVAAVDPVEVPAEISPDEPIVKEEIPATGDDKDDVLKAAEESTEAPVDPAVEEQPVIEAAESGSFGKGAQGVCAVSAPVTTRVPVAKTLEPSPVVPVKTHVAAVDPVEVPAEISPDEPIVKEEIPATGDDKDDVLKAAEESTEVPVDPAVEEQPVIEAAESVTDPVTEVTASIDEPLPIPTESEIQDKDTAPVVTETHVVAEPVETPEREVEAVAETPAVESLVIPAEKEAAAETISSVKPPTETLAVDIEPVVEASVDINKPVVEVVEEPAVELEVKSVEAEPVDIHTVTEVTEGAHATSEPEKVPVEAAVEPEPEQQAAPLEDHTPLVESTCGPVAEGFVVTELSLAVEAAIPETQIPETTTEAPEVSSQMLTETLPAPETVLVPKEMINSQDDFMAQVETEAKKDFVDVSLTEDTMNGCLAGAEVAIEG